MSTLPKESALPSESTNPFPSKTDEVPFYADYLDSVRALRSSLIDAFEHLQIDSQRPREAARQLGLDKSLAWKVTRIIHEDQAPKIAACVPGTSGMKRVTQSLAERALPVHVVESITDAYLNYQHMTETHASDKNSFELMLEGMGVEEDDGNRKSREYAYRGNCGIWGIQSGVRVSAHMLAINKDDPSVLDYAGFGGLTGFQRLRPGQRWPIFQFLMYEDTGEPMRSNMRPISESPDPSFPLIIQEFCKGPMPELHLARHEKVTQYEFGDGIIGKTGSSDVFLGYIDDEPKPRYQSESNEFGEIMCLIDTPIETLMFDLIVDKELADKINPELAIYGRASGPQYGPERRANKNLMPFTEPLKFLNPGAHMLTTPLVPTYAQLGERVINKMGRSMDDVVCWRLLMNYPIMPSTVAMKFKLETAD